ncbi:MAG: HupE/UreJ family protein [Pseudomonadales bacterium]|nr:HupE/UreJ family protein [Pseudomonadales bacterium]
MLCSRPKASGKSYTLALLLALIGSGLASGALGHTITGNDANYVQAIDGPAIGPFIYLGAKHMVTGYDHLLYLFGVVFFLRRPVQVLQFVSLFAIGHSLTLLAGVLLNLRINAFLIDAIIGFSIVYKAFENLGGLARLGRWRPNPKAAVFVFGLFHGLGLASKLQAFTLSDNGLLINMLSFNVGVEIGQLLALSGMLLLLAVWRARPGFPGSALAVNTLLMSGGFVLTVYQLMAWANDSPY